MSSDCPNAIDYLILKNSTHKKNLATRSFKA